MNPPETHDTAALLRHLRAEARARHHQSMPRGGRLSASQRAEYRRMMKDYRSFVRMEEYPQRVADLADRVLMGAGLEMDRQGLAYREFCLAITAMLADLYADFIADDQG